MRRHLKDWLSFFFPLCKIILSFRHSSVSSFGRLVIWSLTHWTVWGFNYVINCSNVSYFRATYIRATPGRYLVSSGGPFKIRRKDVWQPPRRLSAIQTFSTNLKYIPSMYNKDKELYDRSRHLVSTSCPEKQLSSLNLFGVKKLLAHEGSLCGVQVRQYTILHPAARKECFANQSFSKDKTIGYHYCTLLDENMVDVLRTRGVYGEGVMAVTNNGLSHPGNLSGKHGN